MKYEHIVDGWWEMPGKPDGNGWKETKNGISHRVYLPQPVRELIGNNGAEGPVFRHGANGMRDVMKRICTELNVPRATPHDLRRTHGSTITALGFGREAMNRIQNHREGGIASVYDRHSYAEENKRIMEAAAARLTAIIAEGK